MQSGPGLELKESTALSNSLKVYDFQEFIELNKSSYCEGTRLWVFDAVREWLSSERRLFWLVGGAGTGKSVVSAKLFDILGVKEFIGAWHFCRHDNVAGNEVRVILESWAAMLQKNVLGFMVKDVEHALAANSETEMFDRFIGAPLKEAAKLEQKPVIIIMDALDELPQQSLHPVLTLLADVFETLPPFVRLFVTSRDEAVIKSQLQHFDPLPLEVDELRNLEDLRAYLGQVARQYVKMDLSLQDMEAKLEREFGLEAKTLEGKLTLLEKPLRKSKDTYEVVVNKLALQSEYLDMCRIEEVRGGVTVQEECEIDVLYEDAGAARDKLLSMFASEWQIYKTIGSTVLRVPCPGKAAEWVDNVIDPGLKDKRSAMRKVQDEYAGKVQFLKDLARLTVECRDCGRMSEVWLRLKKDPDLTIVSFRNKYANPSPLGYRDFNMTVQVALANGHKHLCEIQINIVDMLKAKESAHAYYESMREALPKTCQEVGIVDEQKKAKFEASVMRMLESSVLDSVIHELELKSDGLFLYASLVKHQLEQEEKGLIDVSKLLQRLPNGLGDVYETNFDRICERLSWDKYHRVIAMIAAAAEPLPASFVQQVVGAEFDKVANALSLLFPIREQRFEVMHKSVLDWLQDDSRTVKKYALTHEDISGAHHELATKLLAYVYKCLEIPHEWETEVPDVNVSFALRHVVYHLCQVNTFSSDANKLALNFEWLLARAALKDPVALISDVENVSKHTLSAAVRLIARALKLSLSALQQDWRFLPAQLVGRLMDDRNSEEVKALLHSAQGWAGPVDGLGWWCPVTQTLESASGSAKYCLLESQPVFAAVWSSDCKQVIAGVGSNVRVWDVELGKCIQTVSQPARITSLASNADGRVCVGGEDHLVRVYDLLNGKPVQNLSGHTGKITSVSWSIDGKSICSGSDDKTLRMWNSESAESVRVLAGHSKGVCCVAWGKDNIICSGSVDKTIRVWEASSGACLKKLTGHTSYVSCVAFDVDGKIYSGSKDKTLRVWDSSSGDCVSILTGHTETISSVVCGSDGRVFSGSHDDNIRVWDANGKCVKVISGHIGAVTQVVWSLQNGICSSSFDRTIRVWDSDVDRGEQGQDLMGHNDSVTSFAWSSDGRVCSAGDENDKSVRVWSTESGKCVQILVGHSRAVYAVAWDSTNNTICSGSGDKTVRVWEASSGKCLQTLNGHTDRVTCVAWNTKKQICSGSKDKSVRVWDVSDDDGKCIQTFIGHSSVVFSVVWTPSGLVCSGGEDNAVRVWDVLKNDCLYTLITDNVCSVAWCDGRLFSGGHEGTVREWDITNGQCLRIFQHGPNETHVEVWSVDGRLCSGARGQPLGVWDITTRQLVDSSTLVAPSGRSGTFTLRTGMDPLAIMPNMNVSLCPSDPRCAIAQSAVDRKIIHTLTLKGKKRT